MKYYKIFKTRAFMVLIPTIILFNTSCERDFLSPDPASFTSSDNFYETPRDLELAVNGVYNRLREQAGISNEAFMTMTEIRFDEINRQYNVSQPSDAMVFEEWNLISSNPFLQEQWSQIYNTIVQANMVLTQIDEVDFEDEELKSRIKGEAKFMRALSYWYAVQFWGNVPLVIEEIRTPDEATPENGRDEVSVVYDQIVTDLEEAITELPDTPIEPGRITEGAAKLLLGKTYLLTEDYSMAIEMLEDVEANYNYMLLPNYEDIWDPANTNNAESIFELQFGASVPGQPHADIVRHVLPWSARGEVLPNLVNTTGWYHPSLDLLEMFEDTTTDRFKASISWHVDPENSAYPDVAFYGDSISTINKFLWPSHINSAGEQEGNVILFRYADALLSLAEAYWRDNPGANEEAVLSLLDRIRTRAGIDEPLSLNEVPMHRILESTYLANDDLGRAIFNERTVELFAEGHRYFDLKRFGVAEQVMQNYAERRKELETRVQSFFDIQPYKLIFPLPSRELDLGNFTQNPQW